MRIYFTDQCIIRHVLNIQLDICNVRPNVLASGRVFQVFDWAFEHAAGSNTYV